MEWTPKEDNLVNLRASLAFKNIWIPKTKAEETTMVTKKKMAKTNEKKIQLMRMPEPKPSNKSVSKRRARTLIMKETSKLGSTCALLALGGILLTRRIPQTTMSWPALITGLSTLTMSQGKKGLGI